ncbi:cell wall-binding repeat-containing protein [Herbiconiux moechotypicola]|uniref:Cell wall-binding repeat-containing protein n=1 Tax=Herbiconiux moechotypicola TaxID=637393 RepID=A0ABP5QKM1_9MICO|nr:cell wall-binding repeat-containing protein [Herbiconiux moechotypicola]MCS5731733.1 cell wall-binding repeat-containing protein [Herbiconiux moechotypicola]
MSLSSPSRAAWSVTTVLAVIAAGALLPVAAGSASASEGLSPSGRVVCPQESAVVGFPIAQTTVIELAAGESAASSISGTLPDGVQLHTGRNFLYGEPARVQSAAFTIEVSVTGPTGTTVEKANCTMAVKASPSVTRVAGADRYDQSVELSRANFTSSDTVYVASGEKYADALSAAAIAAQHEAPLLLTPGADIPEGVLSEIERLGAEQVVLVGGEASVSARVVSRIESVRTGLTVTRIGGADRYAVSRNLIAHPEFGARESKRVYIATGANFPDALTASPAAAAFDAPVLLVYGPEATLTAQEKATVSRLGAETVAIAGGELSVSAALQHDLEKSYHTVRFGGRDRFEVGAALNADAFHEADTVYLAAGATYPDALTGGAVAGAAGVPLYITQKDCLSGEAVYGIGRLAPSSVVILGGHSTLAPALDTLTWCALD